MKRKKEFYSEFMLGLVPEYTTFRRLVLFSEFRYTDNVWIVTESGESWIQPRGEDEPDEVFEYLPAPTLQNFMRILRKRSGSPVTARFRQDGMFEIFAGDSERPDHIFREDGTSCELREIGIIPCEAAAKLYLKIMEEEE